MSPETNTPATITTTTKKERKKDEKDSVPFSFSECRVSLDVFMTCTL